MPDIHPRMAREQKTVEAMIDLYCRDHHGSAGTLCDECTALRHYALSRLYKCPFQERKTTCAQCPVHCYKPAMREKIRVVMRYAGPRMLFRHPILAFFHLIDRLRREPTRPPSQAGDP